MSSESLENQEEMTNRASLWENTHAAGDSNGRFLIKNKGKFAQKKNKMSFKKQLDCVRVEPKQRDFFKLEFNVVKYKALSIKALQKHIKQIRFEWNKKKG